MNIWTRLSQPQGRHEIYHAPTPKAASYHLDHHLSTEQQRRPHLNPGASRMRNSVSDATRKWPAAILPRGWSTPPGLRV